MKQVNSNEKPLGIGNPKKSITERIRWPECSCQSQNIWSVTAVSVMLMLVYFVAVVKCKVTAGRTEITAGKNTQ